MQSSFSFTVVFGSTKIAAIIISVALFFWLEDGLHVLFCFPMPLADWSQDRSPRPQYDNVVRFENPAIDSC